jgi:hypothetical protein
MLFLTKSHSVAFAPWIGILDFNPSKNSVILPYSICFVTCLTSLKPVAKEVVLTLVKTYNTKEIKAKDKTEGKSCPQFSHLSMQCIFSMSTGLSCMENTTQEERNRKIRCIPRTACKVGLCSTWEDVVRRL